MFAACFFPSSFRFSIKDRQYRRALREQNIINFGLSLYFTLFWENVTYIPLYSSSLRLNTEYSEILIYLICLIIINFNLSINSRIYIAILFMFPTIGAHRFSKKRETWICSEQRWLSTELILVILQVNDHDFFVYLFSSKQTI